MYKFKCANCAKIVILDRINFANIAEKSDPYLIQINSPICKNCGKKYNPREVKKLIKEYSENSSNSNFNKSKSNKSYKSNNNSNKKHKRNNESNRNDVKDDEVYFGKVLELKGSITKSDIKIQYRKMMALNHPDKVSKMSKEIRELAEKRTKEIIKAYDFFKNKYNF